MRTYDIERAAKFLNISADTMKELAQNGVVPGAKIGKCWVFVDDDLADYLRKEVAKQTAERRGEKPEQEGKPKVPTAYSRTIVSRRQPRTPPVLMGAGHNALAQADAACGVSPGAMG